MGEEQIKDELAELLDGHPEDIVEIFNPDIGCDDIDPTEGWSHKDFFRVRWGGHPFEVAPGKSILVLRYIGKHIAKHLADHMLLKMEKETGRQGLLYSPIERPAMIRRIFLGVHTRYGVGSYGTGPQSQDERAVAVASNPEEFIQREPIQSSGIATDPALGKLIPEPTPAEDILKNIPDEPELKGVKTSIFDPNKPLPSKKQLIEECIKLNIPITGQETKEQLVAKLKSFAGM
jgi:hypothetical protein